MKISEFINTSFREYADYDNKVNIPNLIDGLKVSQRKILWTFIKVLGKNETVVDRAAMRAAEFTFYKHGGQNLYDVITGMAKTFPGTNNINLLEPIGQFGTRMINEASSPRYISTKLNNNFNKLFDDIDFSILKTQFDEGQEVEPAFLLPKLPLLLINGSSGIGNGFSSTILSYNPKDVAKAVQEVLKHGKVKTPLVPYMNGFRGLIKKDASTKQVIMTGLIEKTNTTTLTITELPPGMQLDKYKAILNKLIEQKLIKDYDNESTEDEWKFIIDCPRSTTQLDLIDLLDKFKLIEKETETLTVWLPTGKIKTYRSVEDMITDWVHYRLEFYEERRLHQIVDLNSKMEWLKIKRKFIQWWNDNAESLVKIKTLELIDKIKLNVTENEDYISKLMNIRVSNLGIEAVDDLDDDILFHEEQISILEGLSDIDMMTKEVKSIKF